MKTRVCRLYGKEDLRIETEELPGLGKGEVLVAVAAGGICGSDIHYLSDGGIGTIRVQEPIILGHEASGRVLEIGPGVDELSPGDKVALNPSRPCKSCIYCKKRLEMHCLNMRFNGSAMRLPHEPGFFRDLIVLDETQCIRVPEDTDLKALACAEPLAVCLHAARMAGKLKGQRILVTGAGPIGNLCVGVASAEGASELVALDLHDAALDVALKMGATRTINVCREPAEIDTYAEKKGHFDVVFECSAATSAIRSAIFALRPRGVLVQVGVAGDTPMPLNALVAKEIQVQGTHRFYDEFAEAVEMIAEGRFDVRPMITGCYKLDDAGSAFKIAADRSKSVKVLLDFGH